MDRSERPSFEEYKEIIEQELRELVDEGKIEITGRLASGEPVYGIPGKPLKRWMWRRLGCTLGIVPSLLAEYTVWYAGAALAIFGGGSLDESAGSLLMTAGRLQAWRERAVGFGHIWPSIKY